LKFVREGAQFDHTAQQRYKEIVMELATLQTQFAQNVLADESSFLLELQSNELDGLPDDLIAAARQAAIDRKKPVGTYGITLSRSLVEPFLTYSSHREKREQAWRAWINRYVYILMSSLCLCLDLPTLSLCPLQRSTGSLS
jgi:peptidyl-dipeptidase Dcp